MGAVLPERPVSSGAVSEDVFLPLKDTGARVAGSARAQQGLEGVSPPSPPFATSLHMDPGGRRLCTSCLQTAP